MREQPVDGAIKIAAIRLNDACDIGDDRGRNLEQYSIQGLNCDDPDLKDLLMDIGTEELSHLEVIGTLARCI